MTAKAPMIVSAMTDYATTTETVMQMGYAKTHLPLAKAITLGFLAGLFLSFAGQAYVVVTTGVDATQGPVLLLGGLTFSVGLMMILVAGAELFTGNCMILLAILSKRVLVWEYVLNLIVIWLSNFLGNIFGALVIYGGGHNGYDGGDWTATGLRICAITHKKAELKVYEMFMRGWFANTLVCLGVIMAASSKTATGKLFGCFFPIALFVATGYEHSIANQYYFAEATLLDCRNRHGRYWLNLLMCTLGNILGAWILAIAYWFTYVRGTEKQLNSVPVTPMGWHSGPPVPVTAPPAEAVAVGPAAADREPIKA